MIFSVVSCSAPITQQFVLFAQDFLVELAHTGLGNSVDKDDIVGQPPFGHARTQVLNDLGFLYLTDIRGLDHHTGYRTLRAWVADKFYKLGWKKQRKSLFPRNLSEKKEDGGVV